MPVPDVIQGGGQGGVIPKVASASLFTPEPLPMRMQWLQHEGSARFQVSQNPVHWDIGLQNGMDVIRTNVHAEQMPGVIGPRIDYGMQHNMTVLRAQNKSGFGHESPGLVLPSQVGRQSGRPPVSTMARYRSRIGAVQVRAIRSEGKQDTNRCAHGFRASGWRATGVTHGSETPKHNCTSCQGIENHWDSLLA